MTIKELKQYLKTLTFGVKDFDKTKEKQQNYKKTEYKQAITENTSLYKDHLQQLEGNIEYLLYNRPYFMENLKNNLEKDLSKTNIRTLKSHINYTTREMNKNFMERLLDDENISYAKNHSFDIVFYINHYKAINKAMHNVLKEIVLNID